MKGSMIRGLKTSEKILMFIPVIGIVKGMIETYNLRMTPYYTPWLFWGSAFWQACVMSGIVLWIAS